MSNHVKTSLILLDILRGYSIIRYKGNNLYFRHFRLYDQLELEEFSENCFQEAVKNGIKTEEELIKSAINLGTWSKAKEDELKNIQWLIDKSTNSLSKISDNIQRKAFSESISNNRKKIDALLSQKNKLTAYSAEQFAEHKKNRELVKKCLFEDDSFTKTVNEDVSYEVMHLINEKISDMSNETNMIHAAYHSTFLDLFHLMSRNPYVILEKNIFEITIWQKTLMTYASILLNKLKNYEIPDDIRLDPVKIFRYTEDKNKPKKVSEGVDDLREKMARNNGKLTAEDLFA